MIICTGDIGQQDEGKRYRFRQASPDDLAGIVALQAEVLETLTPIQQHYIVPKTTAQFAHYLSHPAAETVYVLDVAGHGDQWQDDQWQHAGQIILRTEITTFEARRHTAAFAASHHDLAPYALVQGALVAPSLRGRHALKLMLDCIAAHILPGLPGPALLARIVPPNVPSWLSFIEGGYVIAAAAQDPDDERRVFYLYLDPSSLPVVHENCRAPIDFMACRKLVRDGWTGIGFDRIDKQIIFAR